MTECPPGPLISVIIPCYNHGQFLGEAIESALGQSYPHVEVLVVDDGSTDHSAQVAASFGDRIRSIHKQNSGLSAARNTGILECRGEFVLCLDADDYLWPDMLERHVEAIRAHPTGTVFHGITREVNLSGEILSQGKAQAIDDAFHTLLAGNRFAVHSVTVRRSAFANAGLFDVHLRACEDWEMWIRLAAAGYEFVPVPDAIAVYRRYPGSMSTSYDRMWTTGLAVLRKSAGYHPRCAVCRRVIADRVERWRQWCAPMLMMELSGYRSRGAVWPGLVRAAQAVVRDPALIRVLTRACWSHVQSRRGPMRHRRVTGPSKGNADVQI
jgi:glycosyltransferase involved in cell wall biosynthesis